MQGSKNQQPYNLQGSMLDISGIDEFCTDDPHLKGEEVFGSTKQKLDLPLGAEEQSHRPNKVNFLHLCGSGSVTRACVAYKPVIDEGHESDVYEIIPPRSYSSFYIICINL